MAANISRAQLEKLRTKYQRLQSRVSNLREQTEEQVGHLIQTTEVSLASFGLGLLNGRYVAQDGKRGVEILGVPLDLGLAIGMHAFAFLGGGKYGEHFHNLGDGALASYLTVTGMGVGDRWRQEADNGGSRAMPGGGGGGGALPQGATSGGLTDRELQALANL